MTALDVHMFESDVARESWTRWLARWPIVSCLFVTAMWMLATNDPEAVSKWQEVSREKATQLSLVLESGRPIRQVAFMALGLWGAASLLWPARRYRFTPLILFPLLVILGWAFSSILWSTERSFTAKRLVVFSCILGGLVGFIRRMRPRDLMLLALVGCSVQMVFNVGADLLWQTGDYGKSGYRLSGLQHPNHVAINSILLILACIGFYDRTRLKRFFVLAFVAMVVLLLTKSRSSIIAGAGAIGLFSLIRWPLRNVVIVGFCGAIVLIFFAFIDSAGLVPEGWSDVIHMGRGDAAGPALTGRPMVWNACIEMIGRDYVRYLTGYGYDSFWTPERAIYVSNRVWYHISEGHNAYFDLLLSLGVVGLVCYLIMLFGSLIRWSLLGRSHQSATYAFCAAILMFAVVHGITESTLIAPNFPTFFSFGSMAFLAFRTPKKRPVYELEDDR